MKAIEKLNKLIDELESDDKATLEKFKKRFAEFEMTYDAWHTHLEDNDTANKQGEHDEINK